MTTNRPLGRDGIHHPLVEPEVVPPLHGEKLDPLARLLLELGEALVLDMCHVVAQDCGVPPYRRLVHDAAHAVHDKHHVGYVGEAVGGVAQLCITTEQSVA